MISKTILSELKSGKVNGYDSTDKAIMAWGVDKFIGDDSPGAAGIGLVKFNVNGSKFTGLVKVILNFHRKYDIVFGKLNNKTGIHQTVRVVNNLTADGLAQTIDSFVEGDNA